MNHLFGKKKDAAPPPKATDAVTNLKEHIQGMQKREAFLQKKVDAELTRAKECSKKKDKRGALMALKKKKLFEKEQSQLSNTVFQMEQQMMMLEGANMQAATVNALKAGNDAMKKQMKEMNVDAVQDVMDDVADQMEEMQEITEALGQDLSGGMFDESELEAEFADLEEELLDEQLLDISAPVGVAAPAVGGMDPVAVAPEPEPATSTEDDELAALEAQMAQ